MPDKIQIEISVEGNGEVQLRKITDAMVDFGVTAEKHAKAATGAWEVFKGSLAAEAVTKGFELVVEGAKELFNVFIKEGVKAAQETEDSINSLNNALRTAGNYSKQTSDDLVQFAEKLQGTTKFSSEAVIQSAAYLESLTRLKKDGLEAATKAALDLATVTGKDLGTATNLIAKAVEGNVSSFHKLGIAVREGKTESENLKNVVEAIAASMGGRAEAAARTYSGQIAILGHNFEETQKNIGTAIINNQALIAVLQVLNRWLSESAEFVKENQKEISDWATVILEYGVKSLQLFLGILAEFQGAAIVIAQIITGLANSILKIADAATFGLTGIGKAVEFTSNLLDTLNDQYKDLNNGVAPVQKLAQKMDELGAATKSTGAVSVGVSAGITAGLEKANVATERLTLSQAKLAEEGKRIAEEAEKKDPSFKYDKEIAAVNAAYKAQFISAKQLADSYVQIEKSRYEAEAELTQKNVETIQAQNAALIADDQFKNEQLIRSNNLRLKQILQDEKLTDKQRADLKKNLIETEKKFDEDRLKAGENSLNALATLQNAKSKEIAAVGKAAAIAQATIDTYRGATSAAAALAGIPIVGPALAAAAAGAFIAAGLFRVAQISGVELATGLTEVPPGYENDTFPARLSSGERVVDAGTNKDLKSYLSNQSESVPLLAAIVSRLDNLEQHIVVNIGNKTIVDVLRDEQKSGRVLNAA